MQKEFDPEDPMELIGVSLPEGNVNHMAECLVEEYVRDGWDDESLLHLFRDPFYRATHRIWREQGESYVLDLIRRSRERWGIRTGSSSSRIELRVGSSAPENSSSDGMAEIRATVRRDEMKKRMLEEVKRHA